MKRTIKHIYQPNSISCGPTCLKMVNDFIDDYPEYNPFEDGFFSKTVEEISEMCGTDSIVGTPPDRMEKGMKALGLKYAEYIYTPRPYQTLIEIIDSGNLPILRTITKGSPHWIIAHDYETTYRFGNENSIGLNHFRILDPWLGEITYTEYELDEIWKIRNYQFFEVNTNDN